MRPRGELRNTLADGLSQAPGRTVDLAERTGAAVTNVRKTLDNMRSAGEVAVLREERVEGVRRPVPVYGLAQSQAAWAQDLQRWALGHAVA